MLFATYRQKSGILPILQLGFNLFVIIIIGWLI